MARSHGRCFAYLSPSNGGKAYFQEAEGHGNTAGMREQLHKANIQCKESGEKVNEISKRRSWNWQHTCG